MLLSGTAENSFIVSDDSQAIVLTRSFNGRRSAKEREEVRERVGDRLIAELKPFAQRPMLQKTRLINRPHSSDEDRKHNIE